MRTRKKSWTARELADNPRILHDPETYAGKIAEYFGNSNPIHLEIGCGKGRFITQMAQLHPEINYIAIEREPTILAAAARLSRDTAGLTGNSALIFMQLDAAVLPQYFNPGDIQRLYINFCDPWPDKKKWARRRLTHVNFLAMYEGLMIPEIFLKTDNRLLFDFSVSQFSERGWKLCNISLNLHNSESHLPENIMTEYEEKFVAQGIPVYRLEAYA